MTDQTPGIGDNSKANQSILERIASMIEVGNKWVTERPVIIDDDMANKAASFLRQVTEAKKAADQSRREINKPLEDEIAGNNQRYNGPKNILVEIAGQIERRLNDYVTKKRLEQEAAAAEARRIAEEKAREAREAEEVKKAALEKANSGEAIGSFGDVAATIQAAREKEQEAKQAERDLQAASKQKVALGGEHFVGDNRRSMTQRVVRTPKVVDALKVLRAVKTNEAIDAALLTSARAYHKLKGKWPPGIEIEETTKMQ